MSDIISSGRQPEAPGSPRWRTHLALAGVMVAAGVVGYAATRGPAASDRPPAATPAATPVHVSQPNPTPPAALRCGSRCDRPVLQTRLGRGPHGLRLLVNTNPPKILDAAGKLSAGPRIPLRSGEYVETLLPMDSGTVALVQSAFVAAATPPGRCYRVAQDGAVTPLGRADSLVPGLKATVWMVTYARSSTLAPGASTITQVNAAGRVLVRHAQPAELQILRETAAGLLGYVPERSDGSYLGRGGTLVLVDPATGEVARTISKSVFAVLDVTDDRVAWSSSRRPDVEVYDLDRRSSAGRFRVAGFVPPDYGRLSPDHKRLALGFSGLPQLGTNPASYGYVEVLSLDDGLRTSIDGLRTPPKQAAQLDWFPDGSTLILGVDSESSARIALWTARTHTLAALPAVISHRRGYAFRYGRQAG